VLGQLPLDEIFQFAVGHADHVLANTVLVRDFQGFALAIVFKPQLRRLYGDALGLQVAMFEGQRLVWVEVQMSSEGCRHAFFPWIAHVCNLLFKKSEWTFLPWGGQGAIHCWG